MNACNWCGIKSDNVVFCFFCNGKGEHYACNACIAANTCNGCKLFYCNANERNVPCNVHGMVCFRNCGGECSSCEKRQCARCVDHTFCCICDNKVCANCAIDSEYCDYGPICPSCHAAREIDYQCRRLSLVK